MADDAMERAQEVVAEFVSDGEGWIDTELASLRNVVAAAITAAVEAEREACVKIADSEALDYGALYVLEGFPEDLKRREAAERIAKRIRARTPSPEKSNG